MRGTAEGPVINHWEVGGLQNRKTAGQILVVTPLTRKGKTFHIPPF